MYFFKAHGTANDFVVLEDLEDRLDLSDVVVRALCDRRQGIGADGVLRLGRPSGAADVFMDYRNHDGSIVEMCGNGVRVVAKHVVDHGLVTPRNGALIVGTRDGDKPVTVHIGNDGRVDAVTVDMGPPSLRPADLPFDADGDEAVDIDLEVDGTTVRLTAVSTGNPHAVIEVDDVASAPVRTLGPLIERHARFPKGVNVEFARTLASDEVDLRVWERGVGETAACGTGACATVVALQRLGRVGTDATVHVPGGDLLIRYAPDEHPSVFLTGPAVEVGCGEVTESWLRAAGHGTFDHEVLR